MEAQRYGPRQMPRPRGSSLKSAADCEDAERRRYNHKRGRNLAPRRAPEREPRLVLVKASDITPRARPPELVEWLAELKREATLEGPPRYFAVNRVRCIGQRLHRVQWQGTQWAVTTFGVEKRDGTYPIRFNRLGEDWVDHLAGKVWIDLRDFAEALRVARRHRNGAG